MIFRDCLREAIEGKAVSEVTRTRLVDDLTDFLLLFGGLIERLTPEMRAKLVSEDCPSDDIVNRFMESTDGKSRVHVWMAIAMILGRAVEEWREEEKMLSRPVQ